jgi:hypothetical protein
VEAKVAFRNAILAAQRAASTIEEIARVTGLSVAMSRAALRSS